MAHDDRVAVDYQATNPIGQVDGEFLSVSGLTNEADSSGHADAFSLQINTNKFTTSTIYTDNKKTTGWEQFVYRTPDPPGSIYSSVLIVYWVLGYITQYGKCPSINPPFGTWIPYDTTGDNKPDSCYADSQAASLSSRQATWLGWGDIDFVGEANYLHDSTDMAVLCDISSLCYSVSVVSSVLDLSKHWNESEFNVYGYGGGSQASFNSGTLIKISNALTDQFGNEITPGCVTGPETLTAESNNLDLGGYCGVNSNAIVFKEANIPNLSDFEVSYSTPGGAGTSEAPQIQYTSLGDSVTHTLSRVKETLYVDTGTTWSVTPNPLACTSCDTKHERWMSTNTTTDIAYFGDSFMRFVFYHQYLQAVLYTILPGVNTGSPTPPTWTANQAGLATSQPMVYCPPPPVYCRLPRGDWYDNGSAWSVTNPLLGSTSSEQWVTFMSTSGTVSSPKVVTFAYHHQFSLTTIVSPSATYGTTEPAPGSHWEDYQSSVSVTAKPNAKPLGYSFNHWSGMETVICASGKATSNPCTFKMPAYAVSLNAVFTYKATFKQVGIPSGVLWGVAVGETHYTSKTSTLTVSGLSGTVDYSYDTSVTVSKGGGSYVCVSDSCSGSISAPTTITATYQPLLVVTLISPPDGATMTSYVVQFEGQVTGPTGSPVSGATVSIYLGAGGGWLVQPVCSGVSNSNGYLRGVSDSNGHFSCSLNTQSLGYNTFSWYARATEEGYATGQSPTWTFTSYST